MNALKKLYHAANYALDGCRHAYHDEWAFRVECRIFLLALMVVFFVAQNAWHALALLASVWFVMICELCNSAIERVVDRVSLEKHLLSKQAKDLGSSIVLLASLWTFTFWGYAFWLCLF